MAWFKSCVVFRIPTLLGKPLARSGEMYTDVQGSLAVDMPSASELVSGDLRYTYAKPS